MITKSIHKYIAKCLLCCGATAALTACNDFLTIYPTDRVVGEDFWKTKADVNQMVDGCYKLDNISAVNLLPTNRYNDWSAFYKVINNCNIVLNHAEAVMDEDPEFTLGDYQVVRAQMLALRSLCYFYLVRAFRDVPYTEHSYEEDSQAEPQPQSAPDIVLQHCLDDLLDARQYIMRSGAYGRYDWRNWGYMTRDAIHALMADIYLWRASMTHSAADYQQAIVYSDSVINAKHAYYELYKEYDVTETEKDIYHLEDGDRVLSTIFGTNSGNSHESILEWQYNGRDNSNKALENYYYESGDDNNYRQTSILMASSLFNSVDPNANTNQAKKFYLSANDYRYWNNVYEANNEEAEQMSVRKMVSTSDISNIKGLNVGESKSNSRAFREFRQNWIVYRLTDVMLMKAEALVETAKSDSDVVNLKQAFNLVQAVNKRSMQKTATDTLKFENFKSKEDFELLVLAERERELCFEGKRWWDLMRYCYRHMEGVDVRQTLASQGAWPALYQPMLSMIVRKYSGEGGDAVSYKMKSEPYLYWPILESETKVNNLLNQNPVYIQEKSTSKN